MNAAEVHQLRETARDLRVGTYGPVVPLAGDLFDRVADLVHDTGAVLDIDLRAALRELGDAMEDHL